MRFTTLSPQEKAERKTARRAARRARRNSWQLHFAWRPVRLRDEKGSPSRTIAWLERVAVRSKDIDGMRPWVYGPAGWFLTQPFQGTRLSS